MKQRGFRYCSVCHFKLQKRGLTAAGTQRWYCPHCAKSATRPRADLSQTFILENFIAWLMSKNSQTELSYRLTDRTWRAKTNWCWSIIPRPEITGEIYPVILLDGIGIGNVVCLIARTPTVVVSWHWAGWESSNTWDKLLEQIPPPAVVACYGQKGILLAIARCWPTTRVQRCIFHVWQNIRVKLTLHPQTLAGQELLGLARELLKGGIRTVKEAKDWQEQLKAWSAAHDGLIEERTYHSEIITGRRNWWYTHRNLRSAYRQLIKLLKDNQLFTYLDVSLTDPSMPTSIPRTTNFVEGGINSQLRTKLKLHRGMSQQHQIRLVDWYLYSRTEGQKPPRNFL
jgi:hypothetical protein